MSAIAGSREIAKGGLFREVRVPRGGGRDLQPAENGKREKATENTDGDLRSLRRTLEMDATEEEVTAIAAAAAFEVAKRSRKRGLWEGRGSNAGKDGAKSAGLELTSQDWD